MRIAAILSALLFLSLAPAAPSDTIAVTALDRAGKPIAGAAAKLYRKEFPAGETRSWGFRYTPREETSAPVAAAVAGADGAARPKDPGPGVYRLVVTAAGHGPVELAVRRAKGIPPPAIEVCLPPGASLSGRVCRRTGEAMPGVEVCASLRGTSFGPSSPVFSARAVSGEDGGYSLTDLAPGVYDLWTRREGRWIGDEIVRVPPVDRFDFALFPGAAVTGTVVDAATREPLPDAEVELLDDFLGRRLLARGRTDAAGRYVLHTGVESDNAAAVRVRCAGHAVVTAGDPALRNLPDGSSCLMDVALPVEAVAGGTVTGPGGPVAGAKVVVFGPEADHDGSLLPRVAEAGPDGKWTVSGLPAGKAFVMALADGFVQPGFEKVEFGDECLDPRQAQSIEPVKLEAGYLTAVDVRMKPSPWGEWTANGTVTDPDGKPLPFAIARIDGRSPAVTGPDGRFRLAGYPSPAGRLTLRVECDGYAPVEKTAWAERPDSLRGLEVVLRRRPVLTGRVVGAGRGALDGAVVRVARRVSHPNGGDRADWDVVPGASVRPDGSYRVWLPTFDEARSADGNGWAGFPQNEFVACATATGFAAALSPRFAIDEGRALYRADLVLGRGEYLRGRVTAAADGASVAGAAIVIRPGGGQWNAFEWPPRWPPSEGAVVEAVTDADGKWQVAGLREGHHGVGAIRPGFGETWITVAVPHGARLALPLPVAK